MTALGAVWTRKKEKKRKERNVIYTIRVLSTHALGAGAVGKQKPKPRSHTQFQCGPLSKGKGDCVPSG